MTEVDRILQNVKYNSIILSEELLNNLHSEYNRQQSEIKERFNKINSGCKLGLIGEGFDDYYPVRFVSVINEELGIVKVYEPSINKTWEVSVLKLIYPE